jgi:hypothetical protein
VNLISPLAAGIVGAPQGHAEVYRRGTQTRATVYSSFEADGLDASGLDLPLDEDGSVTRYVNEVVDVVVKDVDGNVVRAFTNGVGAGSVEVRSLSFLGADYGSGQVAAGNPTTLQAVLDLVRISTGGTNWLISGTTTLLSGFGAITGIYYNVKSYGAVGDGTTDDAAAFAAANLAAANAGGGVVFVPAGTYRLASTVSLTSGVSLLGSGFSATVVELDAAGAVFGASNGSVQGVTIRHRTAGTTATLVMSGVATVSNCRLGSETTDSVVSLLVASGTVLVQNCRIHVRGAAAVGVSSNGLAVVVGSVLELETAAYTGNLFQGGGMLLGNYFNCLAHASGTCLAARITTGTSQDSTVIVGNRFEGSGLSGLSAIGLGSSTVPSSYDAGNTFEGIVSPVISAGTATLSAVGAAAARRATLGSRAGRGIQIDVTAHTGVGLAQGLDLMAHDTVVCRDTTGLNARTNPERGRASEDRRFSKA